MNENREIPVLDGEGALHLPVRIFLPNDGTINLIAPDGTNTLITSWKGVIFIFDLRRFANNESSLSFFTSFDRLHPERRPSESHAAFYGTRPGDGYGYFLKTGDIHRTGGAVSELSSALNVTGKAGYFLFDDTREIKLAEEALRESEERFRIAQELSPDGFTILRPIRDAEGRVADFAWVYQNPAIARINGTDQKAVTGERLLEVFPGQAGTPIFKAYCDVAEKGITKTLEEICYQGETIRERTWLRLNIMPCNGDIAIHAQDITVRKQSEEALRERARELAKVNEDLSRFNRAAVDRELRMIELKNEINGLHARLGETAPYKTDFTDSRS